MFHTCNDPERHQKWRYNHSIRYLSSHQRNTVEEEPQIRPNLIRIFERINYGVQINYQQAWRIRDSIKRDVFGDNLQMIRRIQVSY